MSRIHETRKAYDKLVSLLDREIRTRSGPSQELERFRETLDVAFYLLGWAQFEYQVRKELEERVADNAKSHTIDGHAWRYLLGDAKNISVRKRLDIIFHGNQNIRNSLDREYTVRNDAAHDHKKLPPEARQVSAWLKKLEDLVDKFRN